MNKQYEAEIKAAAAMDLPWDQMEGKSFLITGATGMIGSFFIDVLLDRVNTGLNHYEIYGVGRSLEKAKQRLARQMASSCFHFIEHDMSAPLTGDETYDYIIHAASNTHPVDYASDPIGTITTNMLGMYWLLEYAKEHKPERIMLFSSVEIYGENKTDKDSFAETDFGYIDCNTLRAGYPESKRVAETLCQAYREKHGLDIVIPRLCRIYGPSMQKTDSKALAQFIRKGVADEDIVLKSEGLQYFSYCYVPDAVSALFTILMKGQDGEAYNIADPGSDITLKDLAAIIANKAGRKVVFELPDAVELKGYSKATKAILDPSKLNALGWTPSYTIRTGLEATIDILKALDQGDTL